MGKQRAFNHSYKFEIFWHVILGKGSLNMREIARGALQPENNLRSVPENKKQFLLKSFTYLDILKRNRLATKIDGPFNPDGRNKGRQGCRGVIFGSFSNHNAIGETEHK